MKVPKTLVAKLIKTMYPDQEKQDVMLGILDKMNLDELRSVEDVAKVANDQATLNELAGIVPGNTTVQNDTLN